MDINGKSYYYRDLLGRRAGAVTELGDGDEARVSCLERIADDTYAGGSKQKGVMFNLHGYAFRTADINMRLGLDMPVEISRYVRSFKFGERILEEGGTFII